MAMGIKGKPATISRSHVTGTPGWAPDGRRGSILVYPDEIKPSTHPERWAVQRVQVRQVTGVVGKRGRS